MLKLRKLFSLEFSPTQANILIRRCEFQIMYRSLPFCSFLAALAYIAPVPKITRRGNQRTERNGLLPVS